MSRNLRPGPKTALEVAAAPRAGADLRAARERLAWTLADVAARLRIRPPYLQALEDGRLNPLPANAYALGFLRSYATALGLDPEETVRRFRAEAAAVSEPTDLAFPAPVPEKGLPAGAVMLVSAVLAVIIYAGWYRLSGEGQLPAETAIAVPERLAPLAQQAVRLVPSYPVQPVVVVQASPVPSLDPPPVTPAISPSSAAAAPVSVASVSVVPGGGTSVSAAPGSSVSGSIAAVGALHNPSLADQSRLVVRATADSWIQVRDRAGSILLNRVLKAGEAWPAPTKAGLVMTTGNAGGTEIVVDGVTAPSLGPAGMVRRDVSLDPDTLKESKIVVPPAPVRAHP